MKAGLCRRALLSKSGIVELSCGCTLTIDRETVTARHRLCSRGEALFYVQTDPTDQALHRHFERGISPDDILVGEANYEIHNNEHFRLMAHFELNAAGAMAPAFDHKVMESGWGLRDIDNDMVLEFIVSIEGALWQAWDGQYRPTPFGIEHLRVYD